MRPARKRRAPLAMPARVRKGNMSNRPALAAPPSTFRMKLIYSREQFDNVPLPEHVRDYPELRYMGSKNRLLPWSHGVLRTLDFETAGGSSLTS